MKTLKTTMVLTAVVTAMVAAVVIPFKVLATTTGLPENGTFTVGPPPDQETTVSIKVTVPVAKGQPDQYQLYASYSWWDGQNQNWILAPTDDYAIKTSVSGQNLIGEISIPRAPYIWVVVWGKNKQNGDWLMVLPHHQFTRHNQNGDPHYEYIWDLKKQKIYTVPSDYAVRP